MRAKASQHRTRRSRFVRYPLESVLFDTPMFSINYVGLDYTATTLEYHADDMRIHSFIHDNQVYRNKIYISSAIALCEGSFFLLSIFC